MSEVYFSSQDMWVDGRMGGKASGMVSEWVVVLGGWAGVISVRNNVIYINVLSYYCINGLVDAGDVQKLTKVALEYNVGELSDG
jgi:hypothetical protein